MQAGDVADLWRNRASNLIVLETPVKTFSVSVKKYETWKITNSIIELVGQLQQGLALVNPCSATIWGKK